MRPAALGDLMARLGAAGLLAQCRDEEEALDMLRHVIAMSGGIASSSYSSSSEEEQERGILNSSDLEGLAQYIEQKDPRNVICMVGAGLSTAAGIPDFRSPGTGLYDNLQRYNLPKPEAIFDLGFFRESPNAFYHLAKELWPTGKKYMPTRSHYFLAMLEKQGRLLRCYTQNIDMLEQLAGLSEEKVIAAHGNFAKAHTLEGKEVPVAELEAAVFHGIDACRDLEKKYGALVKPDIVFFGESLPENFHKGMQADFPHCDLLIVLGTSLAVAPFNQLIRKVAPMCPRVLVNKEPAGLARRPGVNGDVSNIRGGFRFGPTELRDVFLQGDCDTSVQQLCERLGWADALESICGGPESKVPPAPHLEEAAPDHGADASPKSPSRGAGVASRSPSRAATPCRSCSRAATPCRSSPRKATSSLEEKVSRRSSPSRQKSCPRSTRTPVKRTPRSSRKRSRHRREHDRRSSRWQRYKRCSRRYRSKRHAKRRRLSRSRRSTRSSSGERDSSADSRRSDRRARSPERRRRPRRDRRHVERSRARSSSHSPDREARSRRRRADRDDSSRGDRRRLRSRSRRGARRRHSAR